MNAVGPGPAGAVEDRLGVRCARACKGTIQPLQNGCRGRRYAEGFTGKEKDFNDAKGYGFVAPERCGQEFFAHYKRI
nr:cold shock domain-containing protein [Algiphilus aromaticivorans]